MSPRPLVILDEINNIPPSLIVEHEDEQVSTMFFGEVHSRNYWPKAHPDLEGKSVEIALTSDANAVTCMACMMATIEELKKPNNAHIGQHSWDKRSTHWKCTLPGCKKTRRPRG